MRDGEEDGFGGGAMVLLAVEAAIGLACGGGGGDMVKLGGVFAGFEAR